MFVIGGSENFRSIHGDKTIDVARDGRKVAGRLNRTFNLQFAIGTMTAD